MKRGIATLGITIGIVLLVVAFTQPASAVVATVSGPDQLAHPEEASFETTIDIQEDERIPIEQVNATFGVADEEGSVTAVFTPDGQLESIHATGEAADRINVTALEESLELVPIEQHADFGYGYLAGTDERTSDELTFGYGYGYGYGYGDGETPSLGFDLRFASTAFSPGNYSVIVDVNTGDDTFASNEMSFGVVPEDVNAEVTVTPETLNKGSEGKWVTGYIALPEHDVKDINISTVELNGVSAVDDPSYGFVADPEITDDGELMVKFPRDDVADTLETGDNVTVTVTGSVGDATFTAEDTIRVIDRGGHASPGDEDRGGGPPADNERPNRGGPN